MHFYLSVFPNGKILMDSPMSVMFEINGQTIMGLNGGPLHQFTEAFSLFVNCETQKEIDELWTKLSAGGSESRCGWLKDKFGLSWQIIPSVLGGFLGDPDKEKSGRVMQAMLQMGKLDIAALQAAYDGA